MSFQDELRERHAESIEFDLGRLAELFAAVCMEKVAYVTEKRSFFVYNGSRWQADPERIAVSALAGSFCRDLRDYLWAAGQQGDRVKFPERFLNSLSARKNLLDETRGFCLVPWCKFDENPWLFNFQDGTFDLNSGRLRPHTPADHLTRIGGAWYDGERDEQARETFQNFISDITDGNEEIAEHLQRCAGYSLIGTNDLDLFFFGHGPSTRNGKSTFSNLLRAVFGEYAVTIDSNLFDKRKSKGLDARELAEIGCLDGARLAIASEPDKDALLNAKLMKSATGGEAIKGTELYSAQHEFNTGAKIWIFSNHRLRLDDPTIIDSRRMVYCPFPRHFAPEEQRPGLERILLRDGVVTECAHWLTKGALGALELYTDHTASKPLDARDRYHGIQGIERIRCDLPHSVQVIYDCEMGDRLASDGVDDFLENCTVKQAGARIPLQRLLEAYRAFCAEDPDGFTTLSDIDFRRRISALCEVRSGHGGVKVAHGLSLAENETAASM